MFQESFTIHLGSGQTGKTLSGQLYNPNNTANGSVITGFTEIGGGDYVLSTSVPDLFQGYLNIYQSGGTYLATGSVNNNLPNNIGFWSGTAVVNYATLAMQNTLSGQIAALSGISNAIKVVTDQFSFTSGNVNAWDINAVSGTDITPILSGITVIESQLTALKLQLQGKAPKPI